MQLLEGSVIPRTKVKERLMEVNTDESIVNNWWEDERGDDTMQIVVFTDTGLVRFLWFSMRDVEERRNREPSALGDTMEVLWNDSLGKAMERGDSEWRAFLTVCENNCC
jgi:hypothetical protein